MFVSVPLMITLIFSSCPLYTICCPVPSQRSHQGDQGRSNLSARDRSYFKPSSLHKRSLWPDQRFVQERAVTSPSCHASRILTGGEWWAMGVGAVVIILLTGLLAGLTLGVMSMDTLRLKVWTRTGSKERR